MTRRVCFTIATEYYFSVGYNGSTVPHDTIPGVGLTGHPVAIRQKKVEKLDKAHEGVSMYLPIERLYFLKRNGLTKEEVLDFKKCQTQINQELKVSKHEAFKARIQENLMRNHSCKRKCQDSDDCRTKAQRFLYTET
ncbi:hypothetical protein THRCLA_20793 [Thraustotheca clavata]|uniref:Uncharacterized protein n=1 Tax=Thraustotheca clavata TaxID=74557 RepID=A0A1W0A3D0_9STRA|nr:hypothetical protein THRCLA_20793 [Thraustotheca clavata]